MKDNKDSIDSKTKNKLIIDQYYQPIFPPHYLWIAKNCTIEDIQEQFIWDDGGEISKEGLDNYKGLTYSFVYKKDDKEKHLGVLILLNTKNFDKGTDYVNICSHEASHAVHHIMDWCSIKLCDCTTEVFAFMTGWITECCIKTYKKKHE